MMGNFNAGSSRGGYRGGFNRGTRSFGGGRNFGGRNSYDRGNRNDRQMFKAVCSNCGKDCEVPFNPTGDKPVYCSDCFGKMGGRDDRRPFDRSRQDNRGPSADKYKTQLESINAKLDKILGLLQPKEVTEVTSPAETAVEVPIERIETKSTKRKKASGEKTPEVEVIE